MNNFLFKIQDLNITIGNKNIIKNLSFQITQKGELHILMGPNGSGKSTFSKAIVGHPAYHVENGEILLKKDNDNIIKIHELEPYERSLQGIFLAFQNPVEISGITNIEFLREIYNQHIEKQEHLPKLSAFEFEKKAIDLANQVQLNTNFLYRNLNEGFSGGEKKRNELLQLLLLQPKLIILDELDSGLDIDSMETAAKTILQLKNQGCSIIIISHYINFLKQFSNFATNIHIMQDGSIQKTGSSKLLDKIATSGFLDKVDSQM